MAKPFLVIAGVSGLLAVILGAFGAHGLKGKIDASLLAAFHTGVQYHFYHTLALMLVALWLVKLPHTGVLVWAGLAFILGIVFFSGSLYVMALGGPRWLGPVTPVGGVFFMIGWLCVLISAWRLPA